MVVVLRALAALGARGIPLPAPRGEHVHQDALRTHIGALAPRSLIVLDMGSRPGAILPALPTLVIDHHDTSGGVPRDALLVSSSGRVPVAPSSVLAFVICRHVAGIERLAWLAALGAVGDLGRPRRSASCSDSRRAAVRGRKPCRCSMPRGARPRTTRWRRCGCSSARRTCGISPRNVSPASNASKLTGRAERGESLLARGPGGALRRGARSLRVPRPGAPARRDALVAAARAGDRAGRQRWFSAGARQLRAKRISGRSAAVAARALLHPVARGGGMPIGTRVPRAAACPRGSSSASSRCFGCGRPAFAFSDRFSPAREQPVVEPLLQLILPEPAFRLDILDDACSSGDRKEAPPVEVDKREMHGPSGLDLTHFPGVGALKNQMSPLNSTSPLFDIGRTCRPPRPV